MACLKHTDTPCNSLELAVEAFKELLLEQLAPSDNRAWIEQPFVTFIWMLTSSDLSAQDGFDIITETVKRLTELGQGPLSAEATHASLVVGLTISLPRLVDDKV